MSYKQSPVLSEENDLSSRKSLNSEVFTEGLHSHPLSVLVKIQCMCWAAFHHVPRDLQQVKEPTKMEKEESNHSESPNSKEKHFVSLKTE